MGTWTCTACGGENPEGTRFCGHCGNAVAAEVSEEHLRGVIAGRIGERLSEGGREMPQERRLISALFADVSGFTTLAERLEPEELLEVIDPVIGSLSSIVRKYEGYIEKFAGDALLALFGAPVAHEDDAERALLCGLEMQRELERLVPELPHDAALTLHVGINSGHGIGRVLGSEARADYAVLGDSVILAQRLESAAPPGETYVSQLTYELTRHGFEFEPVGELQLKGKSAPVFAWRLLREHAEPAAARRGAVRRLVGRDDELSALSTVIDGIVHGDGGAVTVTGDAGIGKSRLTAEAKAQAEGGGVQWLETRCLSYGAALPYWPYAELIRNYAGIRGEDPIRESTTRLRQAFAEIPEAIPYFARLLSLPLPDESSDVAELDPEEFRRRLHDAYGDWLARRAMEQPLVLSIEDVHWADSSTRELTRELVARARGIGLVVYLIGRPEAAEELLDVAPDAVRILLGPLDDDQIGAVIGSLLEGNAPRGLAATVQKHTGGNPFFVEELVRSLRETRTLALHEGVWRMRPGWEPSDLPPTLEGVLAGRIDLLSLSASDTLHTASVIGRRIRLPLLRSVADTSSDFEASVEQLIAGGFLDPVTERGEDVLQFHHALVQDVAYSQLLVRRRRELHLQVAEAAESLYGVHDDAVELLARHLYLADAGERAVPYLTRAGERAKTLFANDEAIIHFRRAGELAPGDAEVQLQLADLHELVGEYEDALRFYRVARDMANDVRAWRGLASTRRKCGDYWEALAEVDAAFAAEPLKGQDLAPLWLEAGWVLLLSSRIDQAIDVFGAGVEASPRPYTPTAGLLLIQLAKAETLRGGYESALDHALSGQAILEQHGDTRGLVTALRVLGSAYWFLDRIDEAESALRRALELADRVGSVEEIGACLMNLGYLEYRRDRFGDAISYGRRAIEEFKRVGLSSGLAQAYTNLADALERSGELDEALEYCELAQEVGRAIGYPMSIADTTNTIACVELKRKNYAVAATKAEEAAQLYLEIGSGPKATEILELAAEAWEKAGERERAHACTARARKVVAA